MAEKKIMKLASRGKRFGAACIDMAFPFIAYLIMVGVLAANGVDAFSPGYGYGNDFGYGYGYGYGYGSSHMSGASAVVIVMLAFMLIAFAVVEFVFYAKGKSIGKAMLGLQVVSSIDGKPFGFWKMVLRECIVKSACGSVFFLGYIWILIDEKNRGWHDKILDSYVVDLKESEKMNRRVAPVRTEAAAAPARVIEPAEPEEVKKAEEVKAAPAVQPAEPVQAPAAEVVKAAEEPAAMDVSPVDEEATVGDADIEVATEVVADATAIAASAPADAGEAGSAPMLSMSMKKEELLAAAKEAGVRVSSRATKAEIIEAVGKAMSAEEK